MPDSIANVKVLVTEQGLEKLRKGSAEVASNFERASTASKGISRGNTSSGTSKAAKSAPSYASKAAESADSVDYGRVRGAVGTGAAGRDFAKQSQGLGGLVHLYATFAANIFAVGAAYEALNKAAQIERLAKATEMMSVSVGANLKGISNNLVEASGHALSFAEAMQFTSIGTSAGLAGKQIESLTKIARGAASALGRDANDSVRRIIQGTAKQEQEILDELGIFVKSKQAFDKYANEIGVKVGDLTGRQRTQAYANEVERLGEKWKEFAEIDDPFSRFAATGKNALNDLLTAVNKVFVPILSYLADSKDAVQGIIMLVATVLTKRAIPELGGLFNNIFNYDKELAASKKAGMLKELDNSIAEISKRIDTSKKKIEELKAQTGGETLRTSMYGPMSGYTADKTNGKYTSAGIRAQTLATSIVGTDKNPASYAKINSIISDRVKLESVVLKNLTDQLKDETTQAVVLQELIDKKLVQVDATTKEVMLSKEAQVIAANIGIEISKQLPIQTALAAENKLVTSELAKQVALQAEYNSTAAIGSSKKLATVAPIVKLDTDTAAAAAVYKLTAAELKNAEVTNISNTATKEAIALSTMQAEAQLKEAVATEIATKAKTANSTSETTNTVLKEKNAIQSVAQAASEASLHFAQGISGILPALGSLGSGIKLAFSGMLGAAGGANVLSGAFQILKLSITGVIGTLSALVMPLMIAYTVWEIFGDSIAKLLPKSVQAFLGIGEVGEAAEKAAEKQKKFNESLEISTKNLAMLADMKASGKVESLAEEADLEDRIAKSLKERLNLLTETADKAKAESEANNRRAEEIRIYGKNFSEAALSAKELSRILDLADHPELAKQAKDIANEYQYLQSKLGIGVINQKQYAEQLDIIKQKEQALVKSSSAVAEQRSSATSKAAAGLKSMEAALDKIAAANKKLGNSTDGLKSGVAVDFYNNFIGVLDKTGNSATGLSSMFGILGKSIAAGGKTAALAIPILVELGRVMGVLAQGGVGEKETQAYLAVYVEKVLGPKLKELANSVDTGKSGGAKSIEKYSEESKRILAGLKNSVDAYGLSIKRADNEFANTKAIDDRVKSIKGYASEEAIAREKTASDLKAETQYQKDLTDAAKAYYTVLLDRTLKGSEGDRSKREALEAYQNKQKELGLTKDASIINGTIQEQNDTTARLQAVITEELKKQEDTRKLTEGYNNLAIDALDANLERMRGLGIYDEKRLVAEQNLIDKLKEEARLKAEVAAATSAKDAVANPLIATIATTTPGSEVNTAALEKLKEINTAYAAQIELINAGGKAKQVSLDIIGVEKEALAQANDEMRKMQSLADSIEGAFSGLAESIGDAGKSFERFGSGLSKTLTTMQKVATNNIKNKKAATDAEEKLARAVKGGVSSEEELAKLDEEVSLSKKKSAADELAGIGETAGAAKKMFGEKTAAYKVLNAVETGVHVASMTMKAAQFAADIAALPGKLALGAGTLVGQGGFAGLAAVAGFVAMIASLSGGSASVPNISGLSAEDMQKSQGTGQSWVDGKLVDNGGGVFGDPTAKSESIQNSLDILTSNSIEGMSFSNTQIELLTKIKDGIKEVAIAAYGVQGIRTGSGFGTVEGSSVDPGVLFGLFGSSSESTEILNSGLKFKGTLESLSNAGDGLLGRFEIMKHEWSSSSLFGLISDSGTDIKNNYASLEGSIASAEDKKAAQAIRDVFSSMSEALVDSGTKLGLSIEESLNRINSLSIDATASLKGLTGSETQEELNAIFSGILDDAYMKLSPSLKKFRDFGEGFAQTVTRVTDGFDKVNLGLTSMGQDIISFTETAAYVGQDLYDAQGKAAAAYSAALKAVPKLETTVDFNSNETSGVSITNNKAEVDAANLLVQSALKNYTAATDTLNEALNSTTTKGYDLSEALITAAGGLENFLESTQLYAEAFLTEVERLDIKKNSAKNRLAEIGGINTLQATSTVASELFKTFSDGNDSIINTKEEYQNLLDESLKGARTTTGDVQKEYVELYAKLSDKSLFQTMIDIWDAEEEAAANKLDWQQQLDVLTGKSTQTQIDRQNALANETDSTTQSIMNDVWAQEDLNTQIEWRQQLDVLTGKSTQTQIDRQAALAKETDTTTQSLMKQVWAQQDLKSIIDKYKPEMSIEGARTKLSGTAGESLIAGNATDTRAAITSYSESLLHPLDGIIDEGAIADLITFTTYFDVILKGMDASESVMKGLTDNFSNLSIELLKAEGSTVAATEAFKTLSTKDMSPEAIAQWVKNTAVATKTSLLNSFKNPTSSADAYASLSPEWQTKVLGKTTAEINTIVTNFVKDLKTDTEEGQRAIASLNEFADELKIVVGVTDGLVTNAKSLNVQLLESQGDFTGAKNAARTLATEGMTPLQISLWDANTATQALITSNNERNGLQDEYDSLTMTSAELLEKQRNALDESNVGLFDSIQAIKAYNTELSKNQSLERRLAVASGDDAAVTALDRAAELALDWTEAQRAALLQIYAFEDAAKNGAEALNDAAENITNSVEDAERQAKYDRITDLYDTISGLMQVNAENLAIVKAGNINVSEALTAFEQLAVSTAALNAEQGYSNPTQEAYNYAMVEFTVNVNEAAEALKTLASLTDSIAELDIKLARARGDNVLADQLEEDYEVSKLPNNVMSLEDIERLRTSRTNLATAQLRRTDANTLIGNNINFSDLGMEVDPRLKDVFGETAQSSLWLTYNKPIIEAYDTLDYQTNYLKSLANKTSDPRVKYSDGNYGNQTYSYTDPSGMEHHGLQDWEINNEWISHNTGKIDAQDWIDKLVPSVTGADKSYDSKVITESDWLTGADALIGGLEKTIGELSKVDNSNAVNLYKTNKAKEDELEAIGTKNSLWDKFANNEQQNTKAFDSLTTAFDHLGISIPTTAEEFLALSDNANLTTAAGRDMVDTLGNVSDSFEQIVLGTKEIQNNIFDTFATDEQKKLKAQTTLDTSFAKLGISIPTTAAEFLALSQNADLSTESGIILVNTLGGLTDEFSTLHPEISASTSAIDELNGLMSEYYQVTGNTAALREIELAALDPLNRALKKHIWMLQDAKVLQEARFIQEIAIYEALGNSSEALRLTREKELSTMDEQLKPAQLYLYSLQDEATLKDKLTEAYDKEKSAITSTIDSIKGMVTSLKDAKKSLLMGDLSIKTPLDKYNLANQELNSLVTAANSTAVTDAEKLIRDAAIDKLPGAANDFLAASRELYASSDAYTTDFNRVIGILDSTGTALEAQLTDAEKQLTELTSIGTILDSLLEVNKTAKEYLGELLAQQLISAGLKGTAALPVSAGGSGSVASGGSEVSTQLPSYFDNNSKARSELSTMLLPSAYLSDEQLSALHYAYSGYKKAGIISNPNILLDASAAAQAIGSTRDAVLKQASIAGVAAFAKGGLANGLSLVGEEGPELIDFKTPTRVYSNNASNQLLNNKELIEEIRNLRNEVTELRKEQKEQTGHLIQSNYDSNSQSAKAIVGATEGAATQAIWAQRSQLKLA